MEKSDNGDESSDNTDRDLENTGPSEKGPPPGLDPADFPDGGRKAWTVTAGAWCAVACSFGWISCIGVFQTYYQKHQLRHYNPSTVAWISSIEAYCMFAGAPLWGKLFDSYGPRPLLLAGTFLHVFGLMMASLSSQYYQFLLAQSICSSMGASALFYAGNNSCATWWSKRKGLAFGIISAGSALAGALLPIMIERLFGQVGYPWTMRTCAFLILGLLVISNLTVSSRLKHEPKPWHIKEFLLPFKEPAFLCVALGSFFFFWGVFLPLNFIILEGQRYGMSAYLAGYLVPILNAVSIFGRIVPGWLGDRLGRFNVLVATQFLTVILVLALWIPARSTAAIIVFAALFGFTSGTFLSMIPTIVAQISDVRQIGVRNGSNFTVISLAVVTGNPIAGALISQNGGGFLYMQLFCGLTMFIGASFFFAARTVQCGFTAKRI